MMSNWNRQILWGGCALLVIASCGPAAEGKTWTVGKAKTTCPHPDFPTITAAINAAQDGDEIDVCPALYAEQIVISRPLTLKGIDQQGGGRVLIQPASLSAVGTLGFTAAVAVLNTYDVTISNLAIDASNNTISGCSLGLAGIHFYNSSGMVDAVAVSGTQLQKPASCPALFPGNGSGVQIDEGASAKGPFRVTVQNSSIHDFSRNGILVIGKGETVNIDNNFITGVGPSTGVNQFGIFLASGASGRVTRNQITQGNCGTLSLDDCWNQRSEGVVLRSTGDGVVVDGNVISNIQSAIFVNGQTDSAPITNARITNNVITNADVISAIHIQGTVSSIFSQNRISHVGPINLDTAIDEEGCGINAVSGTGNSGNTISWNWVTDAYCGVAYVTGDSVFQ